MSFLPGIGGAALAGPHSWLLSRAEPMGTGRRLGGAMQDAPPARGSHVVLRWKQRATYQPASFVFRGLAFRGTFVESGPFHSHPFGPCRLGTGGRSLGIVFTALDEATPCRAGT